ncbi:MAG TPA: RNA polymerase sigma factor SigJ [Candidatus Dormibacteraeota bacterium]
MEGNDLGPERAHGTAFNEAWATHRNYLLNIAYRMVGSFSEAEDLVQEAYSRLLRTDDGGLDDIRGWLVVVVTRLSLDHLRSARVRRESTFGPWLPEPLALQVGVGADPADVVTLDESVRMALLIVLEQLTPAERAVFVLHDAFQFTFEEIANIVERSPAACRQLGSRARRAIRAGSAERRTDVDVAELRHVAERFIAACSTGNVHALLEVLDPDVVGWADMDGMKAAGPQPTIGADDVAQGAMRLFGTRSAARLTLAEVNGEAGIVVAVRRRPIAVIVLTVRDELITAIYAIVDPKKLRHVHVSAEAL